MDINRYVRDWTRGVISVSFFLRHNRNVLLFFVALFTGVST